MLSIHRGPITIECHEKSVRVICANRCEFLYLERKPTLKDINFMEALIQMGANWHAERIEETQAEVDKLIGTQPPGGHP